MFTHEHHHHLQKLIHLKDRLGLLYTHLVIQSFALSLISIFIPIFLLSIGYSLRETFLFLLIEWAIYGLFTPIYGRIIHKIGLKEVIFIRTPLIAMVFIMLAMLETEQFIKDLFYFIPILYGLAGALYTISISVLFADFMGDSKQSFKTAKYVALPQIAAAFGPLLGGIIALYFGFMHLFILVTILLVLSLIPLITVQKNIDHPQCNFDLYHYLRSHLNEFIAINAYGVEGSVYMYVVPIVIYLFAKNTVSLGIIVSIVALLSAVFTLYTGHLTDKYSHNKILTLGVVANMFVMLLLGLTTGNVLFYYLTLLSGILTVFVRVPYETYLFQQSRNSKSVLGYIVYKEFSMVFGRTLLYFILAFGITDFRYLFFAVVPIFLLLLLKNKE